MELTQSFKKIIHIDMDAFYASVEQRDNPALKGKPIAVGGGGQRGVTTTASYEARKYGVRSAMPGWKAKQLCPNLIFVKPRFDAYKKVSQEIRSIFHEYTELVEPLSLDEAFLDVTTNKKDIKFAMEVAKAIMSQVLETTSLTCSAGVSYCKFLAKVASGYKKPNGMTIIHPDTAVGFLEKLAIKDFFGVGKVTAKKMAAMGIETGGDLKKYSKLELSEKFGKRGRFYYDIVRGIDEREVEPHRIRKSIGVERTFESDISDYDEIAKSLSNVTDKFLERVKKANNYGRTLTLKIKTSDFQTITRSTSKEYFIKREDEVRSLVMSLLERNFNQFNKIRLIGLTTSNLEKENVDRDNKQLSLE